MQTWVVCSLQRHRVAVHTRGHWHRVKSPLLCRYEQVKALKEGKTVQKPIYNHVSGLLDPPEETTAPKVLIIEGLHPFFDDRVSELCDYKIYLDISDEVKFAWKIQRDMKERGHSLESIKQSIEARKPDFDAYIDPQKAKADLIIQVRTPAGAAEAALPDSAGQYRLAGWPPWMQLRPWPSVPCLDDSVRDTCPSETCSTCHEVFGR